MCHNWDLDPMYLVLSLFTGRNKESILVPSSSVLCLLSMSPGRFRVLQDCYKFYSECFTEDQKIDYIPTLLSTLGLCDMI